ncbi:MAG: short-chain dehydrogenase, partial [Chloroflexi bacterium]|nr:short-chain dehydrogenase [Chloroflexota bacterium]
GTFLCSRAAARTMVKQREGKIINVASMDAFITARNMADYSASKGGVLQLTRATALDLVKYNIQVNAICPGYFLTPMNHKFFTTEAGKKVIDQKIPMRRLGNVEELKGIAIYLASSASSFTTGAAIIVDGGQTIW